ncbi:MAG: DNA/RNA nuclease SfsA [Oscillospiraceae bacterium]
MNYQNIHKGIFISRPNRFIANVIVEGKIEVVHVKNTGRCKELLTEGCTVYLEKFAPSLRKTNFDLIAVEKGDKLINMDSQAPNKCFYEWAKKQYPSAVITPEVKYHSSRFDCLIKTDTKSIFTEVKGVTLEENGLVTFPDAPTLRGLKHINELISARQEGYQSCIFFVIQMENVKSFSPNYITQPEFGKALKNAKAQGVEILAYSCTVTTDSLNIDKPVPIIL